MNRNTTFMLLFALLAAMFVAGCGQPGGAGGGVNQPKGAAVGEEKIHEQDEVNSAIEMNEPVTD